MRGARLTDVETDAMQGVLHAHGRGAADDTAVYEEVERIVGRRESAAVIAALAEVELEIRDASSIPITARAAICAVLRGRARNGAPDALTCDDHVHAAKVNALNDAADIFERDMAIAWGGGQQWLTTGTQVAELVADILRERAHDVEHEPNRMQMPAPVHGSCRAEVKAAVEEWFTDIDLDDLFAIKGWSQ